MFGQYLISSELGDLLHFHFSFLQFWVFGGFYLPNWRALKHPKSSLLLELWPWSVKRLQVAAAYYKLRVYCRMLWLDLNGQEGTVRAWVVFYRKANVTLVESNHHPLAKMSISRLDLLHFLYLNKPHLELLRREAAIIYHCLGFFFWTNHWLASMLQFYYALYTHFPF